MISATFRHHLRHWRLPSRPLVASASSTAMVATASGISQDQKCSVFSAVGCAAGLAALGIGLAAKTRQDENSVAGCEPSVEASSWRTVPDEEGEDTGKALLRTIARSELKAANPSGGGDGGKSERAFTSALDNSLFNPYEDGADDWEEVEAGGNAPAGPVASADRGAREEEGSAQRTRLLATTADDGSREAAASAATGARTPHAEILAKRLDTVRNNDLGSDQVYTKNMYFYQSAKVRDFCSRKLRLFALPSSENLGKEMAYLLGTNLHSIDVAAFADGETKVEINDMVRGKEVFVVCTTTSTNAIMELLLSVSAMRRGSAKRICAVIPYYGYSRQDRRTKREPIAAADIAIMLEEMGVDSVICVDLHDPLLKGFFSPHVPVDHLMPGPVAAAYFYEELYGKRDKNGDANEVGGEPKGEPKITIVAAHETQVFRANRFRNALQKLSGNDDIKVALITNTKALNVKKDSDSTTLVGNVEGRTCIIVDDIINTGGTLTHAIREVDKSGASEVYAWATHGVLHLPGNDAPEKIQEMDCLKYVLISNSVTLGRELPSKIRKLSIAPLLAESVARALHNESISTLMNVKAPKSDK